jgi:hypothetical protein
MNEDQPLTIDNFNTTSQRDIIDIFLVNNLREQVHKAFLQVLLMRH